MNHFEKCKRFALEVKWVNNHSEQVSGSGDTEHVNVSEDVPNQNITDSLVTVAAADSEKGKPIETDNYEEKFEKLWGAVVMQPMLHIEWRWILRYILYSLIMFMK